MGMNQFHFLYICLETHPFKINIRRQFVNQTELESLTIAELHALAKQNGIPSYRKYKKAELISLLKASAPERPAPKKRGRPPKAKPQDLSAAKDPSAAPVQSAQPAPAPKKRGRPPKARVAEPAQTPAETTAPEQKPVEAPRRNRSRSRRSSRNARRRPAQSSARDMPVITGSRTVVRTVFTTVRTAARIPPIMRPPSRTSPRRCRSFCSRPNAAPQRAF